ncbi:hypothetical protein PC118_g11130 [Phytophthora cactorum]|uniref:Major facilitator superfamily domain n=1 Tax=Phytophthora cactorum TaxID=29920 RepID=A0A8T1FZL5_9STRA|nr:hypothetical protein PC118_g11130 [Phytophthora cactorum]
MDISGVDTARDVQRLERLSYVGSAVSSRDDEDKPVCGTPLRKLEDDEEEGLPLRSGDVPNLYHWRHIGLLVQYAAVGLLYGGLPRTVYPFLNNYLHLNGYQTLSARVLLSLPWSFKVMIGVVSDCFPISRSRRRAYMVIGWVICSSMLLILVFVKQEPPYYMDSTLRGKDLSKISPAELKGRVNLSAPDSGSLYIVLMMLASLGYMIADVASDGLVVEFAQREPENIRGNIQSTVYLVRSITMILAALLVGFGLNSEDYGGSFSWSLSVSQLMLIFSLLSLVAIPAAIWLVQEPAVGDHVPQFGEYMRSLWILIQNSAMVQILAYRFFSGIFDGFTVTAGDPIQRYWARVHPLNESLFSVLGLVVFSAALYVTKSIALELIDPPSHLELGSSNMLRFLYTPTVRAAQKSALQQRSRAVQVLARRPAASTRSFTSTRSRLNADKATPEGQKAPDALVLTPYEKVTATATGGFWLGLIGLGAVGVYFVARELLPNRMSPNGLFSESLDFLSENTDVTSRLGLPIHGYGHDHGGHREGRRNRIEHVNLQSKDGTPRLRIKYNIKGPSGHAYVFAEVNQNMKKNEYVYLIVQVTKTGELLKIIDNRQILAAETKEEQDALRQLLG